MPQTRDYPIAFWVALAIGAIATDVLALGIHVTMLQVMHVPFPDRSAVAPWAALANTALAVFALMVFHDLARGWLAARRWWTRWIVLAAVFGMLKEAFRAGIMSGVVTTAWAYDAAQAIGPIIYSVALGGLVVLAAPRTKASWARPLAALAVAAVMSFLVRPLSAALLAQLMRSIAYLDHPEMYPFPYGWHVLSWAYVTYLEPVVTCIAAAALAWPMLSRRPVLGMARFTALIVLIKGALLPTLLYGLFDPDGYVPGMVSESQFLLEAIALGLLGSATWRLAVSRMPDDRARGSDATA